MLQEQKLAEVKSIIEGEHSNPHNILGMHEIIKNNKVSLVVRSFMPDAKRIICVDVRNKQNTYELEKVDPSGFFEIEINRNKKFSYKFSVEGYNNNWEIYDPYSFDRQITDFDIYLFKEGTNYKIYEKLGANTITVDGIEGVLFGVWAPNAKRVSVIGSFNNWDGRTYPLRNLDFSGVWEIFIPGLQKYDMYKFEIKTQEGYLLQKSDPYANFSELRPGKASMVYNINQYKWNDQEFISLRERTSIANSPLNIYEVHLGSWKRVPEENNRFLSYIELAHDLVPYVLDMGYTHIEIMPIQEHPLDASWGYQVTGYYSPTSRYGNPDEFKYFIDYCHQNGIGVILDWVPAHFPKDDNGLANFDGTALYEHADTRKGEHLEWGTKVFNYGRNEVKNFLIANAIFWIEKYHLDGLRVDAVASMLYLDYGREEGNWIPNKYGGRENEEAIEFMKHMNSIISNRYPNVMLIAEESTSWAGVSKPAEENGLGFNLKWNMGWMNDFLSYVTKDPIHRSYHHGDLTFGMVYAYTENFVLVLSHDEVVHGKKSLVDKMPGDLWQKFANLRVAFGFMYGHPGKKLTFMGGEFGQFSEWSEAKSLDWDLLQYEHHAQMKNYMKDLNFLYKENKALWFNDFNNGGFQWISCNDYQRSIVSFVRTGEFAKDIIVFVCNFTPTVIEDFRLGVPFKGNYKEIFNSDNVKYGGSGVVNINEINSESILWDNFDNSIALRVPPLAVAMFRLI